MLSDKEPESIDKLYELLRALEEEDKNADKVSSKRSGSANCSSGSGKTLKDTESYDLQQNIDAFGFGDIKRDVTRKNNMTVKPEQNSPTAENKSIKVVQKQEKRLSNSAGGPRNLVKPIQDVRIKNKMQVRNESMRGKSAQPIKEVSEGEIIKNKQCDKKRVAKVDNPKSSYNSWHEKKAQELKLKAEKEKLEKQRKDAQKSNNLFNQKEIREQCFNSWLNKKQEQRKLHEKEEEKKKNSPHITQKDTLKHLQERKASATEMWQTKKRLEAKKKKEAELEKIRKEEQLKEEKKQKAAERYREWMKSAHLKPRPAPLNRGLNSLNANAGWVNPIPWRSNISSDEEY